MRLYFRARTNSDTPYINVAIFRIGDKLYTIDRHTTNYSYEEFDGDGYIDMEWREVYIWDGENEIMITDDSFFDNAELIEFELEDDVPEDYFVEDITWDYD